MAFGKVRITAVVWKRVADCSVDRSRGNWDLIQLLLAQVTMAKPIAPPMIRNWTMAAVATARQDQQRW